MRNNAKAAVVIGYGSALRGDDGLGPAVAAAVAERAWPGVRALAVHQLTPELADVVVGAGLVVFVDARANPGSDAIRIESLVSVGAPAALGHTGDPRSLLALTEALHGCRPPAWWVTVPGQDFGLREGLSPAARTGMAAALRHIELLIGVTRPRP
jgi:hydrogenase maturation protease